VCDLVSNIWAGLILLLGPIAGLAGSRKLRTATPRRKVIYLSNAANLIVLGSVTAAIDLTCGHKALGLQLQRVCHDTLDFSQCPAALVRFVSLGFERKANLS